MCLVHEKLPNLEKHLEENYVNLTLFTTKWFLCLFVNVLPYEVNIQLENSY
jgi:hypothetical protein